jgi:hypothetical protein
MTSNYTGETRATRAKATAKGGCACLLKLKKQAELSLGLHGRDARTYTEPGSLIDVKPWAPPRTYTGGGILISGQRRYARDMDEKDLRRARDVSIKEAVRNGYGHVLVGSRHPPCGQGYAAIREIAEGALR